MTNGLNVTLEEFRTLPQTQKLDLLYQNTEQLKIMIGNYKFHMKILYSGLSLVSAGLLTLFGIYLF